MNQLNNNIISITSLNHKIIYMIMRVIIIMIGLTVVKRLFKSFLFLVDTLQVSTPSASQISWNSLVKVYVTLSRKKMRYLTIVLYARMLYLAIDAYSLIQKLVRFIVLV